MALPVAMTMRSTTSRQTLRNYPNLAESPREPVVARRLGLNKVHDLSATEARVPRHRCAAQRGRSEEHTSELQSPCNLVCRLLLEKKTICARDARNTESVSAVPNSPCRQ